MAATQFDFGNNPSVAYGPFGNVVEVHQGASGAGPLWYSTGSEGYLGEYPSQSASWSGSSAYDYGANPSVASGDGPPQSVPNGPPNSTPTVVEVHQAGTGPGPLWYRTAVWNGSGLRWNISHSYDSGMSPSVAVNTSGTVVEVHQGGYGAGALWYRVGSLSADGSSISWGSSYAYDTGASPSVAMAGNTVIEVHQAGSAVGPLWYRVGTVSPASHAITFGPNHEYDYGMSPSVAVDPYGIQIREVHQAGSGSGPLWTRTGTLGSGNTVNWSNSSQYDNGVAPHVAEFYANAGCITHDDYTEVHQAAVGLSPLWYDVQLNPCVPMVQ